jgi:predicted adenylyl cyclase CyaB
MKTEFECRFIDIDVEKVRAQLAARGFELIEPEHLMRRMTFDLPDKGGAKRWLRLRDEGNGRATLTVKVKCMENLCVSSMKEIECEIGDYEIMGELLQASDHICKSNEENKREKWVRGDVEVCLDTWPGLNTFAEIEAQSEEAVIAATRELGFDYKDAMFGNVTEVYKEKLGLSLEQFQKCCTFENPPK